MKLPLMKMSFRFEKHRLLHGKGYLFAPGPVQWNISVFVCTGARDPFNDIRLFEENPSELFLAMLVALDFTLVSILVSE